MSDMTIQRTLGKHEAQLKNIEQTQTEHGKKLDEVRDAVTIVKNNTEHMTMHMGELMTTLKETHAKHETRIDILEKGSLLCEQQNLNERLTTLENKVNRAFWYGLGTLGTAATALAVGLTTYWHKVAEFFHGN